MAIFSKNIVFNYISILDKTNYRINYHYLSRLRFNVKGRILYLAIGAATFLIAYSIGAAVDLGSVNAENLKRQFAEQIKGIDQIGIFINNVKIALIMFFPLIGIGVGVFSGFSTGLVFSALAQNSPLSNVPPLVILITPFGIMEVFAYGLAISRSGLLIYHIIKLVSRLVKKGPWREYIIPVLIKTGVEIGIVIVILLAGAIIEWHMISHISRVNTLPKI